MLCGGWAVLGQRPTVIAGNVTKILGTFDSAHGYTGTAISYSISILPHLYSPTPRQNGHSSNIPCPASTACLPLWSVCMSHLHLLLAYTAHTPLTYSAVCPLSCSLPHLTHCSLTVSYTCLLTHTLITLTHSLAAYSLTVSNSHPITHTPTTLSLSHQQVSV